MCQGVISQICNAFKSKRKFLKALLLLCLSLLLTSCLEVKHGININKDGSGEARLEVAVQQEWASQLVPKLKGDMPKGWSIVEEKEKEGKHVVIFSRKFKDISELNDNETRYSFSAERKSFLKKSYILEVSQLKSSDMPFPYEITIKVPGSIDETDGTKLSANEVRWNLQGLKKGKALSAKSSAFALPDFASLKESFNRIFNSLFYREAIVFLRDNNLWIMDSDGKNQRQLTKDGVGNWSVSRDGKIVFDRFSPIEKDKGLTDLNVYHITSVENGKIEKLTNDNKSIFPNISPDGTKVVFQKTKWDGQPHYGGMSGEGIWFIDLASGKQEELVGVVSIPDEIKKMRNEIFARYGEGEMDEKDWFSDANFIWSYDSKQLLFSRRYKRGGVVTYMVNLEDQQHPTASPNKFQPGALDLYNNKILYFHNPSFSLYTYDIKTRKEYLLANKVFVDEGKFLPDGRRIVFEISHGPHGSLSDLWIINSDGKDKRKITQHSIPFIESFSLNGDANKIIFQRYYPDSSKSEGWTINIDGSNLKKLADNASSPEWTSISRISVISPNVAKIIILAVIALAGILLLLGIALIARKAINAVVPRSRAVPKGIFCPQCGKENSPSASFCTNCGQKLH